MQYHGLLRYLLSRYRFKWCCDICSSKAIRLLKKFNGIFFAVIVMIGVVYSFAKDSHIRLDILHSKFSTKNKEIVEIIGIIFMLWPMIYVFFIHSLSFVAESFRVGERSMAPMGLGYRWAIKSIIPFAFFLLFFGIVIPSEKELALLLKGIPQMDLNGILVLCMMLTFISLLFTGYPIAFILGGVAMLFTFIGYLSDMYLGSITGLDFMTVGMVVNRLYKVLYNWILIALPLFIFMGLMLDRSGIAEK